MGTDAQPLPSHVQRMGADVHRPSQWRLRLECPKLNLQGVTASRKSKGHQICLEPAFYSEYRIHGKIGSGTVAVVKRGTRLSDSKEVALKFISSSDEEVQQFARDEYQLLQSLRHESIVRAEMLHVSSLQVCIVLEFCNKGCLQAYVEEHGPMNETAVKPLFHQFLQAVDYLHKKRIVHRDLKPDNVLLSGEESEVVPSRLKIIDFNSAQRIGDGPGASALLSFRGTQLYFAPELLRGAAWNERVDIWCYGLCLFFAVRGELPFDSMSQSSKALLFQGCLPEISWQGLSLLVQHITSQCLAVDMRDRPPAMELLHHDLFQEHVEEATQSAGSYPAKWPAAAPASRSAEPLRQLQMKKLSRYSPPNADTQGYRLPPTAGPPETAAHPAAEVNGQQDNESDGYSAMDMTQNPFFTWSFPSRSISAGSQTSMFATIGEATPL